MFANDEIDSSMIIILTKEGDRMYLHQFDEELHALEYLEMMLASFRTDILEKVIRRSMN